MTTLQRRHYEVIAAAVKGARTRATEGGNYQDRQDMIDFFFLPALAEELAQTNPQFDRERFVKACGVEP